MSFKTGEVRLNNKIQNSMDKCKIQKHDKARVRILEPGLYIAFLKLCWQ